MKYYIRRTARGFELRRANGSVVTIFDNPKDAVWHMDLLNNE